MLVTERIGRVRVYASGEPDAELLHTATIPDVRAELESGLMGIAVHGTSVFVCASRDPGDDWKVELLRSTLAGDGSLAPFDVMPIGETTGGARHQGCAVEIDASDHLWLSVGDANLPAGEKHRPGSGAAQRNPASEPRRMVPADTPFGPRSSEAASQPAGPGMRAGGAVWEARTAPTRTTGQPISPVANTDTRAHGAAATPIPDGADHFRILAPEWRPLTTLANSGATFLTATTGRLGGDLILSTLKRRTLGAFRLGRHDHPKSPARPPFGRLRAR